MNDTPQMSVTPNLASATRWGLTILGTVLLKHHIVNDPGLVGEAVNYGVPLVLMGLPLLWGQIKSWAAQKHVIQAANGVPPEKPAI